MTKYELTKQIAEKCSDAYSYDRYASWQAVTRMLLDRGYTPKQTEAILRSKLTRWAADFSEARYGKATSKDLSRYMDKYVPPKQLQDIFDNS